jgi:hypothetical protein
MRRVTIIRDTISRKRSTHIRTSCNETQNEFRIQDHYAMVGIMCSENPSLTGSVKHGKDLSFGLIKEGFLSVFRQRNPNAQ